MSPSGSPHRPSLPPRGRSPSRSPAFWHPLKSHHEPSRRPEHSALTQPLVELRAPAVFGNPLLPVPVGNGPQTGFFRNNYCDASPADPASHTVAAVVTPEFLDFSKSASLAGGSSTVPVLRADATSRPQAAATTSGPSSPRCAPPNRRLPPPPPPPPLSPPPPRPRQAPPPRPRPQSPASGASAPRGGSRPSAPPRATRSGTASSRASSSRRRTSARPPTASLRGPSWRGGRWAGMGAGGCRSGVGRQRAEGEGEEEARLSGGDCRRRRGSGRFPCLDPPRAPLSLASPLSSTCLLPSGLARLRAARRRPVDRSFPCDTHAAPRRPRTRTRARAAVRGPRMRRGAAAGPRAGRGWVRVGGREGLVW